MVNICPAPLRSEARQPRPRDHRQTFGHSGTDESTGEGDCPRCADRTHAAGPCNFGDEVQFQHEGVAGSGESAHEMAEVTIPPGVEMIGNSAAAELLERIRLIWQSAQSAAVRSVNSAHVCANWLIGRQIVEAEQGGSQRAEYGRQLLESLSKALATEYGGGFSVSALRYMRLFYLGYPNLIAIHHAPRAVSVVPPATGDWRPGVLHPSLSWTHYRTLLKSAPYCSSGYSRAATRKVSLHCRTKAWSLIKLRTSSRTLTYWNFSISRNLIA
jgi:hypothetical protein